MRIIIERILQIFVGLSLFCLVALAALYLWYRASQSSFALELAKSVLQILVVVVLGTMGTLLTGEFNRRRAEDEKRRDEERRKAENRDELRKNLLERLNRTYFDFKRAKRLLRAKAFTPPYYGMLNQEATVNLEQYDEQLEILNDAQLELEHIAKDVEANHMLFEHSKEIAAAIRVMEESLKQVVTEWERKRGNLDGKNPPKISDLPCLKAVVGPGYQAEINRELWGGYQKAALYIQQGILEPNE